MDVGDSDRKINFSLCFSLKQVIELQAMEQKVFTPYWNCKIEQIFYFDESR